MAIPYERVAPPPVAQSTRPPLVRPVVGRRLGGVCAGVAGHLNLPVGAVRWATIVLVVFGAGLPAYLFLWAVVPSAAVVPPVPGGVAGGIAASGAARAPRTAIPAGAPQPPGAAPPGAFATTLPVTTPALSPEATWAQRGVAWLKSSRSGPTITLGFIGLGLLLLLVLQSVGVDVQAGVLAPLLILAAGAVVVWSDLDRADRDRALGISGGSRGWLLLRLGLGASLVLVGLVTIVTRETSVGVAADALLSTVALLAGFGLLAAPWALRLWTRRQAEQQAAARAMERADIAAHLHDSVLQTLALIQRRSTDPLAVTQLARAQERELRSWLYAGPSDAEETLAAAVAAAAHEIEDLHGIPVELVVTGDRPMDPHGNALTMALREALGNAVRHGRPPVSVYVEIGPAGVEAFVRDRGDGFDLDAVPADRLGVRHSVLERMARHGGTARIRQRDDGTEVELTLPPLSGGPDDPAA